MKKTTLFWFRRDLRLHDNAGLFYALKEQGQDVLPVFIFDKDILGKLEDPRDARVTFLQQTVAGLKASLQKKKSDLVVRSGVPLEVLQSLAQEWNVGAIYANHDYEPAARTRDEAVLRWASSVGIEFKTFKDQTLFEKDEILTDAGKPYTVYTPYKNKVLKSLTNFYLSSYPNAQYEASYKKISKAERMPSLHDLGFTPSTMEFPPLDLSTEVLKKYATRRDFPAQENGTTHLGLHLRFGTVSVRELAREGQKHSAVWLSELIWRDFFMQIFWHYPRVVQQSFRPEYDGIAWRKDKDAKSDFERWCLGMTGYPLV
ncbi:MAG: deoxyribodipyrimidine photo-lyase, partial [Bdellovibrio sp.]|nr:deoxyribodipyrimidine photo-lyase [Bdellovibrio sp.]